MTKSEAKEVITMLAGKQKDIPLEQVFKVIDLIDEPIKTIDYYPTNIQWPQVYCDNRPMCDPSSNANETKGVCCERR